VLLARRWRALASPAHAVGLPALLLVCASWPLLLHNHGGQQAVGEFLIQNGVYRVFPSAGAYGGGHARPWWFYLPRIPQEVGWVLVFVPALVPWLTRGRTPPGWRLPAIRFAALVLPAGLLLISIPGTKRGLYLAPFLPLFAVAIGAWAEAFRLSGIAGARAAIAPTSPLRLLAAGFAISLAYNVFVYPRVGPGRDLGPFVREVATTVGDGSLASFALTEEMRGALPFYAGIVATDFVDADALGRHLARDGSRYVLTPVPVSTSLQAALGSSMTPVKSWIGAESSYRLYAYTPE
jgi:hypothetical protein